MVAPGSVGPVRRVVGEASAEAGRARANGRRSAGGPRRGLAGRRHATAYPHIRPWHQPMPARVSSLTVRASRGAEVADGLADAPGR